MPDKENNSYDVVVRIQFLAGGCINSIFLGGGGLKPDESSVQFPMRWL